MVMLDDFSWKCTGFLEKSHKFPVKNPTTWPYKVRGLMNGRGFFYMVHRSHTESGFLGSRSNIVIELYWKTRTKKWYFTVMDSCNEWQRNGYKSLLWLTITSHRTWHLVKASELIKNESHKLVALCKEVFDIFNLPEKCKKVLLLLKGNFITVHEEHFVWKTTWLSYYIESGLII